MTAFHVEHLTVEGYLEAMRGVPADWEPQPLDAARRAVAAEHAWQAWVDGAFAGCAGVALQHPGMAVAWALVTAVGHAHPLFVLRHMRRGLVAAIRALGVHRVQADVRVGYAEGYLLMQHLGFKEEGTMRCYAPDKAHHVLFSLTEEDYKWPR